MASFNVYPEVEASPKPEIEPSIPPPPTSPVPLALPPLASYPSREALLRPFRAGLRPTDMHLLQVKVSGYIMGAGRCIMHVIVAHLPHHQLCVSGTLNLGDWVPVLDIGG
jgi:hypothetical protein